MYVGVPMATPANVSVSTGTRADAASAFATPKSVTMAEPAEMSTFSGLMSRCTTPCACEYARAEAISRSRRRAACGEGGSAEVSASRSDCPSTYGMVKYGSPSASPAVSSGTMCGCCSDAATRISRRNRSWLISAESAGLSTLMTTILPSAISSARNTRLMPPAVSSRFTS